MGKRPERDWDSMARSEEFYESIRRPKRNNTVEAAGSLSVPDPNYLEFTQLRNDGAEVVMEVHRDQNRRSYNDILSQDVTEPYID